MTDSFKPNPTAAAQIYAAPNPFENFTILSKKFKTLNFGQGFPDFPAEDFVKDSMKTAISNSKDPKNYLETGPEVLTNVLKEVTEKRLNNPITKENIFIAGGASGVFTSFIASCVADDEEVVLFDPTFFFWVGTIKLLGKKVKKAPMDLDEQGQFQFNPEKLKNVLGPKSRVLVVVSPSNPDGKVWNKEEQLKLKEVISDFPNLLLYADEVYNCYVYDREPQPLASVAGLFDRTVTGYSIGKEVGCTGWRSGWGAGPCQLISRCAAWASANGAVGSVLSHLAMAESLKKGEESYKGEKSYFEWSRKEYGKRRDKMYEVLAGSGLGIKPIKEEGGYTMIMDISDSISNMPVKYFYEDKKVKEGVDFEFLEKFEDWKKLPEPDFSPDEAYGLFLIENVRVTFIPGAMFYYNYDMDIKERNGVRFLRTAICKDISLMEELKNRFEEAKNWEK